MISQIWMPEVYNEDNSGLFTIVPSLMLKRIIKNVALPVLLFASLISDTQATALNIHNRHMESKLRITHLSFLLVGP